MKLLQSELKKRDLDCAIFMTDEVPNPNLFYFTKYKGAGFLIIPKDGKPVLHVPSRDLSEAKMVKGVIVSSGKKLSETLNFHNIPTKKIGIDFSNITLIESNALKEKFNSELVNLTSFMEEMRSIKRIDEINQIERACKITDFIIAKFIENFKKFKTEEEASAFLVYEARKLGSMESFEPIVATGPNAAVPHHTPKGKIHKGFCVIDFGVKSGGYCSDVTRTIYYGKPSKEEEKIYYDLLENQEKAISLIKPGIAISDLCLNAEKDLKQKLIHSLGHGIGIEVHEFPYVSTNSKSILKEGMVITIEPGEYLEGKYGIRIEDDVLVTKGGQRVLSKLTKKLIIIK